MTDYGPTDTTTTTLGANQYPAGSVFIAGDTKLTVVGGANKLTDGNGKTYAEALTHIADGSNVTQGTTTDAAATTDTGTFSLIALFKRLLQGITTGNTNTTTIAGTVSSGKILTTETNSAASKTDLDSIATNTSNTATSTSSVNTALGAQADAAASTDTSTASYISLFKRLLAKFPSLGAQATAASSAVTIATDDAVLGATSASAVVGDVNGSVNARLRGVSKIFNDVWDSTNHWFQVKVMNGNANGQAVMANSSPVVIASDQSPVAVKGGYTEVAGNGPSTVNAINTDLIPSTDVSAFKWLSLHVTGTYSATLTFQASNDNVNWVVTPLSLSTGFSYANTATTTGSTNVMFSGPVYFRYFRVRATAFTSNASLAGTLELYDVAPSFPVVSSTLLGTTAGNLVDYHLISAASTNGNSVKTSAGQLYGYEIGNSGASDAWVKLYNKASAPTVGTDATYRTIYVPKGTSRPFHTTLGVKFSAGISIAVTGGAADSDTTAVAANQVTVDIDYI